MMERGDIKSAETVKAVPVFEVLYSDGRPAFRVWANGQIEGFPEGGYVINRVPQLVHLAWQVMRDKSQEVEEELRAMLNAWPRPG